MSDESLFKLLDSVVSEIGIFRTMQLLNDIEMNNWMLARRYAPLHPRTINDLRSHACEYRLAIKKNAQSYLISQTQLKLSA